MKRDFVAENPNNLSRKLENRIIEKALKKNIDMMKPMVDMKEPFKIKMSTGLTSVNYAKIISLNYVLS